MAIDPQLQSFIESTNRRLENLENTVRRLASREGPWDLAHDLLKVTAHLSQTRDYFIIEALRQKGLLDGVDVEAITEKLRDRLTGKSPPWAASEDTAKKNLEAAAEELKGKFD